MQISSARAFKANRQQPRQTCDYNIRSISQDTPNAAAMSLKDGLTFPFPYAPQPRCTIPTPTDDKASSGADIQCTDIVTVSQE